MSKSQQHAENQLLQCDVCLQEIPASESRSDEASDYVVHFCGLDCYELWRQKQADSAAPDGSAER